MMSLILAHNQYGMGIYLVHTFWRSRLTDIFEKIVPNLSVSKTFTLFRPDKARSNATTATEILAE